jgi:hypothetical protein
MFYIYVVVIRFVVLVPMSEDIQKKPTQRCEADDQKETR